MKGIFGGTFDPIHCGHLEIAEYLFTHLPFKAMHFIPCFLPPHRQTPKASPEHRLAMLKIAIGPHPEWLVDEIDFKRPGPSYMVDTLRLLRQAEPDTRWVLILGMDAYAKLHTWRQWQEILQLCHLLVVNRPEFEVPREPWSEELLDKHEVYSVEYLQNHAAGGILFYHIPPLQISGTAIRYQIKHYHQNLWLPPEVFKYIEAHGLYLT